MGTFKEHLRTLVLWPVTEKSLTIKKLQKLGVEFKTLARIISTVCDTTIQLGSMVTRTDALKSIREFESQIDSLDYARLDKDDLDFLSLKFDKITKKILAVIG